MEHLLSSTSLTQLLCLIIIGYLSYGVFRGLYNLYFHPLSRFPGPKLHAAFYFPYYYDRYTGDFIQGWHEMHKKYGVVVRIAPSMLSTISPEAWRDIYGHGKGLQKDWTVYARHPGDKEDSLLVADDANHTRMRRLLNYAFSEQALRSQEGIINSYIDLLIEKLHIRAESQTAVDVTGWMNSTTFDITGDLAFDEPFGALESDGYHFWIDNTFKMLKYARIIVPLRAYPIVSVPLFALLARFPTLSKANKTHMEHLDQKLERRLKSKTERKDFLGHMLKYNDEKGMTPEELRLTSSLLIMAGSETSATCLSGAIFYLLKNHGWLSRLQKEIREAFQKESEISFASLSHLKVLHAVIQETLRMYPPVAGDMPRMTPSEGAKVCGTYIPPHTRISIPMYPAFRSALNFKNPDTFAPERWLGDEKYADDRRSVLQPFSIGSRNCIGQNLAWAEIRTILARLVWHFDMELMDESRDWVEGQKVYFLWYKPALMVKLKARSPQR